MAKKIELLAPAGNYDAFLAAVENGADAVYLGGKLLNARQFAGNFDNEELQKAIDYAHVREVRILLTLNTLVLDNEMQEAVEYAARAYEMGVDAFILQDVGLAARLKKAIPGIPIHASTQMTVYNLEGVKALERMGFERAVLARELELGEIKEICRNTALEIEIFIHGALCIGYSGQCLMSSMIGGRSGNRGKCAQPCRMHYSVARDGKNLKSGYLLSPKDICYIDHLAELINAGVTSLKIEGRMKSPEYVATVVGIYRKYLDMAGLEQQKVSGGATDKAPQVEVQDRHRLLQSFNRGGFSKGYLLGKSGPEMMAFDKPKNWGTYLGTALAQDRSNNSVRIELENTLGNGDGIEVWTGKTYEESPGGIITKIVLDGGGQVKRAYPGDTVWVSVVKGNIEKGSKVYKTSDKEMLELAVASFSKPSKRLEVKAAFTMKAGKLPELTLEDFSGNVVTVRGGSLPEKAVNKPLTGERISEQLKKMGATPFDVVELNMDVDNGIVIPISELNNIRRKAAELLEEKRILSGRREIVKNNPVHFPGNIYNSSELRTGETENVTNNSNNPAADGKKKRLSVMLYRINQDMELDRLNADRIYIPFNDILNANTQEQIAKIRNRGKEVFAYIPAIIKGKQTDKINKNMQIISERTDGFLIGNIGAGELLRNALGERVKLMGDYTLNLLNSSTLAFFREAGYTGAVLSYELNLAQLSSIIYPDGFDTEVGVYGRVPVITSEYCPVGGSVGNTAPHNCKAECKSGVFHLRDRRNAEFLVRCDCVDCRSTIFNSNVMFAPELLGDICETGVRYIRMSFVNENNQEIYDIVNLHRDMLEGRKNTSAGRITIENIKNKGITKGHLQRGV